MIEKRVTDKANEVIMSPLEKSNSAVAGNNAAQPLEDMSKAVQRLTWLAETNQETKQEEK